MHTLQKFATISGPRMNSAKTRLVWIANVRFLGDMKFCWDPGIFRVLRVTFSTEVQQICAINYGQNLEEIINILIASLTG